VTRGLRRRHRLYWRIWLAVLASLALVALITASVVHLLGEPSDAARRPPIGDVLQAVLPPADAPRVDLLAALVHWREKLASDIALYDHDGALLAATADDLPAPPPGHGDEWLHSAHGRAFVVALPDGRVVVIRRFHQVARFSIGLLGTLALIALGVGAGAYPIARRLTRRLEALQAGVEQLGRGGLPTRVDEHGHDEVAQLAQSFNAAAERIESLLRAQRSLLANASHELRSPLARVRMAVEMLATDAAARNAETMANLRAELVRNIAELDQLIDEILLASRLDAQAAGDAQERFEPVDLTSLAREQCAQANANFATGAEQPDAPPAAGATIVVQGDARLLRRLLDNLLENARRYGQGSAIDVALRGDHDTAVLTVCDRGPGVPAADQERVFEPFFRVAGATEAAGSVGLGLALVRKIAEQHGGQAEYRPRPGGGSCFVVILPLAY